MAENPFSRFEENSMTAVDSSRLNPFQQFDQQNPFTQFDAANEEPPSFNKSRGALERGAQLLSGLFRTGAEAADYLEEKIPLGGFVFDGGLPKYYGPEKYAEFKSQENVQEPLHIAADKWKGFDAGYVPEHTWESVKEAFTDGEMEMSDIGAVVNYGIEQGIKSIPDMAAVMLNLPGYVVSRSGEMAEERALNKGKPEADIADVLEAMPFALGSALLEKVGASRMANPAEIGREALEAGIREASTRIGKDALASAGTEAVTEAIQEGIIEYAGEKFGTGADMSWAEAGDRALAGAVAGGVYGGAVGGATSTANEITGGQSIGQMVLQTLRSQGLDPAQQAEAEISAAEIPETLNDVEYAEYSEAVAKGLDMSQEARMQRAQEMGFDTETVLYHGTKSQIDEFAPSSGGEYGGGIYLTDNPDTAWQFSEYAKGDEAPNIVPVVAKLENPYIAETRDEVRAIGRTKLEEMGHDGIIATNPVNGVRQIVVFSPENIRSVNAAFDPESESSADILANDKVEAMDMPMSGYVPLYSMMETPARPADEVLNIGENVVKLNPATKPTRREGIRTLLTDIIGPRLYQGKIKGKSRLGFYRRSNSEVRIKNYDDVEVMAHEMAHYLDFHYKYAKAFTRLRNRADLKEQVQQFSYTSDPKLVSSEGFAEFVRLWLTNYDQAASKAPEFTEAFEDTLARDPAFKKKMLRLQGEMHKWFNQGPLATMRAKSGKQLTPEQEVMEFLQKQPAEMARQNAIDKIHGIKVVERTTKGGIQDASKSAYKQFQMINGAESMHEAVIKYGTPELTENGDFQFNGKGLEEVFKPVAKHGWERFDLLMEYFKARRAQELMSQGRENLFTKDEIKAGLKLGEMYSEFRDVFRDYQQFNKRMLDFYVQMGLISNDQRTAFQKMNQNYVPFHRVIESIEDGGQQGQSQIGRRLTGGSMNTKDIAENIIQGLYTNIRGALLARAKVTLFTDIMKSQEGSLFAARIPADSRMVKAEQSQQAMKIAEAMARMGLGISSDGMILTEGNYQNAEGDPVMFDVKEIAATLEQNPELMSFWQHGVKPQTLETYVDSINVGGKQIWFEVRSPLLVQALTGMRGFRSGVLLNALFKVKNLQTRTVTSMLQFLGPNAIRDTVSSFVISKNKFIPVFDTLRGMGEMIFNSDLYKEFMLNGGGYGTRIEARTEETRSRRQLDLPPQNGWDRAAQILAGYDRFASTFEYGSRLGDYRKGRKAGKNALEAAWEAREVATDFAKMPRSELWAKYLRMVPFMNAGIQGLDKTFREIFEMKGEMKGSNLMRFNDGKVRFMLAGGLLTTMTGILWLLNNDDDRYRQLTPDQKARFWWIFPPDGSAPIKIPRPYDVGHIFATIPEISLDYIKEKDGADAAENLAWTLVNTLGIGDYPGIVQPMIEVATNKTFTGAPVVPNHMLSMPAEYQYNDRTPILYRELGKSLGVSPMVAEHYAKGYLRYVESYISDAVENLLWDKDSWGDRPFSDSNPIDYLTYQFKGQKVPYRTKWTEGYFNLKTKAAGITQSFNMLQEQAIREGSAPVEAFAMDKMNQALIALNSTFGQIDREFQSQDQIMAAIRYNPTLSREQKEEQIEAWYAAKNETLGKFYQQAEKIIRDIEKEID